MTFKELAVGEYFDFTMRALGMPIGPWCKVSTRRYVWHHDVKYPNAPVHQVGTINVHVVRAEC